MRCSLTPQPQPSELNTHPKPMFQWPQLWPRSRQPAVPRGWNTPPPLIRAHRGETQRVPEPTYLHLPDVCLGHALAHRCACIYGPSRAMVTDVVKLVGTGIRGMPNNLMLAYATCTRTVSCWPGVRVVGSLGVTCTVYPLPFMLAAVIAPATAVVMLPAVASGRAPTRA